MHHETPGTPQGRNPTIVIVITVLALVVLAILGVVTAVAVFGGRRDIVQAKLAEARAVVSAVAGGVARCSTPRGYVPPSSPAVPAAASMVSGKKYMSRPSDWSDEAFRCAAFSLTTPQYFRYQWVRESEAAGVVRAEADFDGDGAVDVRVELEVACRESGCRTATAPLETHL